MLTGAGVFPYEVSIAVAVEGLKVWSRLGYRHVLPFQWPARIISALACEVAYRIEALGRVPGRAILSTRQYDRGVPTYHLQDPLALRELSKTDLDLLRIARRAGEGEGYELVDIRVLVRERGVNCQVKNRS